MSLKVEQKLLGQTITENTPIIYSAGVFLRPLEVQINGNTHYMWVADEFGDNTYLDGKLISPFVIADNKKGLIGK